MELLHLKTVFIDFLLFFASTLMASNADIKIGHVGSRERRQVTSRPLVTNHGQDVINVREWLDVHNMFRGKAGAANMQRLDWDDTLAREAKDWASRCDSTHGIPPGYDHGHRIVGQNLYFSRRFEPHPTGVLHAFHEEKAYYTFDTDFCRPGKVCGHYTQLVWAESRYVGCATHKCERFYNDLLDKYQQGVFYAVCHYGPGGNVQGQKAFIPGAACTLCPSGKGWCKDNLCVDSCKGEDDCECKMVCKNGGELTDDCSCRCPQNFLGKACQTPCKDFHPLCGKSPGLPAELCESEESIRKYCPALCGLCSHEPPTIATTTTATTTTSQTTTVIPNKPEPKEATVAVTIELNIPGEAMSKWEQAWEVMAPHVETSVNSYCRNKPKTCCPDAKIERTSREDLTFTNVTFLSVAKGYPMYSEPKLSVIIEVTGSPNNSLCQHAQTQPTPPPGVKGAKSPTVMKTMMPRHEIAEKERSTPGSLFEAFKETNGTTDLNACCDVNVEAMYVMTRDVHVMTSEVKRSEVMNLELITSEIRNEETEHGSEEEVNGKVQPTVWVGVGLGVVALVLVGAIVAGIAYKRHMQNLKKKEEEEQEKADYPSLVDASRHEKDQDRP